jgi:serine/threonine-protein kinase
MGEVFDTFDRVLRRRVALKVLRPELARSSPERDAFVREARLTSRLEHPHIVPVHDLFLDPAAEYAAFLMKRIEGRTLSARLDELSNVPMEGETLERVLEIMLKVCDAVAFAHAHGVLHLDLKPDNVMLGDHGEVYVMDWGIAVECEPDREGFLEPLPVHRGLRGSLAYMAPEQLSEQARVDQRTDIHGLGAILYEILSGRPPYTPSPSAKTLVEQLDRPVLAPLSEVGTSRVLPPGLVEIAERALSPERESRYPSVAALKLELEAFRRGGGWFASRSFAPGQVIVCEGEPASAAYVITEGRCEVRQTHGARESVLREMGPSDVFGETALLTAGPRTASVVALSEVRALVITKDALERELADRHWLGALMRALAERFAEADRERAELRDQLREARARRERE